MQRMYSLAYLSSQPLPPPDALTLAANLGYQAIGVRIQPAVAGGDFSPLITSAPLVRETQHRIRATGVAVFDVEIVRLAPDFRVEAFQPFLGVCAALGARAILVAGDDPDEARLIDSYAAFCEVAATYGLTADLEFMPWTQVPDCQSATRIVSAARQANSRILVDALHFARSSTTLGDVAAIPRDRLGYAQLCDAPAEIPARLEDRLHTARSARHLPGEGGIDLVGLIEQLPPDLPISVEIPNTEQVAARGIEAWCRDALVATKAVVALAVAPQARR